MSKWDTITSERPSTNYSTISQIREEQEYIEEELPNSKDQNQLSFVNIDPVPVRVRDLSISARLDSPLQRLNPLQRNKNKNNDVEQANIKTILDTTSFDLRAGSLMAIIGGSGSGKTTLLNVLANRSASSTLFKKGEVSFGGKNLNHIRNAYVIQQDILSPNLTARETLIYATELRLPDSTTKLERLTLVEEVILELGLKDCADTIVGDSTHKGLSGGEKRRLSIGIQILSNPSVLFLDEPTTGLDAHSAYLLIKTLKQLANRGRTIIISIHQPRSDIFFLFDYLCILSQGKTVYSYKVDTVLSYFGDLGYTVPENVNPADYLIDITAVDVRTTAAEEESSKRLVRFVYEWKNYEKGIINGSTQMEKGVSMASTSKSVKPQNKAPFWRELTVLTRRTFLLTIRDSITLLSMVCEAIFMGIICGWVFYKPNHDLSGIRTMTGAAYSANSLQGYLMLLFEVYRLSSVDIKLFDRERSDNCVSIVGFLLSRRIAKLFTEDIIVPLFFSLTTYFMFGFVYNAKNFFIYYATIFLIHETSMTGAMLSVSLSRNFANASLFSNLNYTLQSMACGYFVNAKTMPVYVRWTKYIAYVWYGFGALIANQFTDFEGDCPYESPEDCVSYQGKYIIHNLGFWDNWITVPIVVILCWSIGFYLVAGVILKFNKVDVALSKQVKSATPQEKHNEELQTLGSMGDESNNTESLNIDVNLSNLCLGVRIKKARVSKEKVILDDISATFKSGKVNAIMGPSGSGKSSLLNLISGRLSSDLINRYTSSGDIFFNNYIVTTNMVNSICSYVSQDDDHLLSTLSVRETLAVAADLRLGQLSKTEKSDIVEDIISKLGLRSCANTLVGSEFIKGISGGEKRRVSIAIQLLNNPKILLLDEPTSGLDSFTASSILEILQELAKEGKTIILTIHQPRSDLFQKFGQVLLLAKGGRVGYNGEQQNMVSYFASLGYACPKLTNSADHVLDLISVNNQNLHREKVTKERVDFLLKNWEHHTHLETPQDIRIINESEFPRIFGSFIRKPAGFSVALYACIKQLGITTLRNQQVFIARISQVAGLGVIIALFFAPLKNDFIGISNRLGLVQEVTSLYFCGMLNNLSSYPDQRNYFYHEYDDRVYGILPFFLSYMVVEIPFEIISSFIFAAFLGPVVGLPRTPEMFFAITYVSFLTTFCGESLGIITNTIFHHAGFAVNVVSIILSIGTFMAGVMSLQMDSVLKGINWISPLKYGLSILLNMAFPDDLKFKCDDSSRDVDGNCIFSNGDDVLRQYGLKAPYKKFFGVLLVVAFVYRFIIAYGILRIKLLKINLGVFSPTAKK